MKLLGTSLIAIAAITAAMPALAQGSTSFSLVGVAEGTNYFFEGAGGAQNPTLSVPASSTITVTLTNRGGNVHNIQVEGSPASDYVETDEDTVTYTFTSPASGSVAYYCVPHKANGMGGQVTVFTPNGGTTTPPATTDGEKKSPGFEVVALGLAVVGAALLLARRK